MRIFIYSSIILFCVVVCPVSGDEAPPVENCTVLGEIRIVFNDLEKLFPQICAYFNNSEVSISFLDSGLYFMSMCYNNGWASGKNSEEFCHLSGYINTDQPAVPVYINEVGTPKFSNFDCVGSSINNISQCGGNVITGLCNYVSELTCEPCSSYTDCLSDNNSLCNADGKCSCKECENGVCYVGGCLCSDGYAGDTCRDRICSPPCQNSGQCRDDATCDCEFPYAGQYCETLMTCSPSCLADSVCLVDMENEIFSCCAGEIVGNTCILPATTTATTTATTMAPPATDSSSFEIDPIVLGVAVFGVLFCLIVVLSFVSLCLCVMVCIMMKNKMHQNDKSEKLDFHMSDFFDRTPTIYSAVDERRMMDFGMPPALPPARNESQYVEMDKPPIPDSNSKEEPPEKKTSHYEIEDSVLEAKTSLSRKGHSLNNYENETVIASTHEESTKGTSPNLLEASSPNLLLKRSDSDWQHSEPAYENPINVSD